MQLQEKAMLIGARTHEGVEVARQPVSGAKECPNFFEFRLGDETASIVGDTIVGEDRIETELLGDTVHVRRQ